MRTHSFRLPRLFIGTAIWTALCGLSIALPAAQIVQEPTAQGPLETLSPSRDRVVLNGLWKALPAVAPSAETPVEADWGTIWVPGSWIGGFNKKGAGQEWATAVNALQKVWYERMIDIPASWKGRRIVVDFRRVSTDATVSVNGVPCGGVAWPYGQVDITKAVTPGSKADLRILVAATADTRNLALPMGPGAQQQLKAANKLTSAGLIGEVFLLSAPQGPTVTDVFVQPSVRKKQVALEIEVTGMTQDATAAITATMFNAAGQPEQVFRGSLPLKAAPVQQATLTFPWPNPTLWTPEHPNLYNLRLDVAGPGIQDSYPERFGFREFWVDGQKFFLNGQELRLRPAMLGSDAPSTLDGINGYIDGLRKTGFNIIEQQPVDLDVRGVPSQQREVWCEKADEKGFLTIADAVDADSYLTQNKRLTWWDPGVRDRYQARFETDSRRYRNHPSVVMWTTTPNRYGQFQDQNPRTIGVREIQFPLKAFQLQDIGMKAGLDAMSIIHAVDPTRPAYSHAGDMLGDLYTINTYLDLIPLQEREEWLSDYAEKGNMPYMAVEFGLPMGSPTFQSGRNGYLNASMSQPELTEFSAIYLGAKAYSLEAADYREGIISKFDHKHSWSSYHNSPLIDQAPAFQQLEALFIRNTFRSWRAAGITGGMIPWGMQGQVFKPAKGIQNVRNDPFQPGTRGAYRPDFKERQVNYLDTSAVWAATPSSDALIEVNGPTLAWIAGAKENFYEKSHSFRVGQTVKKQVCLINDLPSEAPYHVTWRAVLGGKVVGQHSVDGNIAVATNLFLPLEFSVPGGFNGEKAQGEIDLDATIGGRVSSDKFPFRVFNPAQAPLPKMYLLDSQGKTAALLKSLGADAVAWNGAPATAERPLLVIGRDALSSGKPSFENIEKFVTEGGRLLMMSQDPEWMRKFLNFRISRQVSRRFWPVMADHPITAGLDAEDLRDWAGAGTLIEARPTYPLDSFSNYGWHWGNQGSVSCAAVEMPHLTGWTPVIQGEFDMAFSPLMELAYGKGAVVLCTLDLEDQAAVDPVAEILARRILCQTVVWNPAPRRTTVFIGNDDDAKLLQSMGLLFQRATSLPAAGSLVIVGPGAAVPPTALNTFASQGGNVFVLASPVGKNVLGSTVQNQEGFFGTAEFQSSFNGPLAGLSVSDLHFRVPLSWTLLTKGGATVADGLIAPHLVGRGAIVEEQLDPRLLDADHAIYFHLTRWRQTRAMSQILANLGAIFVADGNIFRPDSESPLYYPDYIAHVWDGDDPARYYRW